MSSASSSIEEIVKKTKTFRFRIRDVFTLRDYLCIHRINRMWMSAVCLETGFQTQFLTIEPKYFCLSHPAEIEFLKTMKTSLITELIALNTGKK